VLVTAAVHAIPVSTAVRHDDTTVAFGLGLRRGSLQRLRADPACALVVLCAGVACTLYGTASVKEEVEGIAAVIMDVTRVADHRTPAFTMDAGVAWQWIDDEASARDAAVRSALRP
jgi:hypothetical protein